MKTKISTINKAKEADTPIKAWKAFMTDAMIDMILENTNRKIEQKLSAMNGAEVEKKNMCHMKHTTAE